MVSRGEDRLEYRKRLVGLTIKDYYALRRDYLTKTVREARLELGLSVSDVALLLDVAESRIVDIEAGQDGYRMEELEVLAPSLGIQSEEISAMRREDWVDKMSALSNTVMRSAFGERLALEFPEDIREFGINSKSIIGELEYVKFEFSLDGRFVAAVFNLGEERDQGSLCVWSVETGVLYWRFDYSDRMNDFVFVPNSDLCLFSTGNDTVIVMSMEKRSIVQIMDPVEMELVSDGWWRAIEESGFGYVHTFVSPDGAVLVTISESIGIMRIYVREQITWVYRKTVHLEGMEYGGDKRGVLAGAEGYTEFGLRGLRFGIYDGYLYLLRSVAEHIVLVDWARETVPYRSLALLGQPRDVGFMGMVGKKGYFRLIVGSRGIETVRVQDGSFEKVPLFVGERRIESYIDQIAMLGLDCILAVGMRGQGEYGSPDSAMIWNLASGKGIVLHDADMTHFPKFAPGGDSCVYWAVSDSDEKGVYPVIQKLNVSAFVVPGAMFNLGVGHYHMMEDFPVWVEGLTKVGMREFGSFIEVSEREPSSIFEEVLDEEDEESVHQVLYEDDEMSLDEDEISIDWRFGAADYFWVRTKPTLSERFAYLLNEWACDRNRENARGFLHTNLIGDLSPLDRLSGAISIAGFRVCIVDLEDSSLDSVDLREFLTLSVGRDVLRGELTDDLLDEVLNRENDFIFVKNIHLFEPTFFWWLASDSKNHKALLWMVTVSEEGLRSLIRSLGGVKRSFGWLMFRVADVFIPKLLGEEFDGFGVDSLDDT